MYLPAVSLGRMIFTTCPLFRPKYLATGSPLWILGSWCSFSLLQRLFRTITVSKFTWKLASFAHVVLGNQTPNFSTHTAHNASSVLGISWNFLNYNEQENYTNLRVCPKLNVIIASAIRRGYYLWSSSFFSSTVMTMCSGTNWKKKKNNRAVKSVMKSMQGKIVQLEQQIQAKWRHTISPWKKVICTTDVMDGSLGRSIKFTISRSDQANDSDHCELKLSSTDLEGASQY